MDNINIERKTVLDFSDLSAFENCELPIKKDKAFVNGAALRISTEIMESIKSPKIFVGNKEDDWSGYEYLQMSIYSKRASQGTVPFLVMTETSAGDDSGYLYYINVSWSGHKTVTIPLNKGIETYKSPKSGLDKIIGYCFLNFDQPPGEMEIYIDDIWVTNSPIEDKERFIEADENVDYHIDGVKNQRYDAIKLLKDNFPNKKASSSYCRAGGFG